MNMKRLARHEKFSFSSTDCYFFCGLFEIIYFNLLFYEGIDLGPERWGSFLSSHSKDSSVGLFPHCPKWQDADTLKEKYRFLSKKVILKQEAVSPRTFCKEKKNNKQVH